MDCSPPSSSVHGFVQARILEWFAISSSRGFSKSRDGTHVSCIGKWILDRWATRGAIFRLYTLQEDGRSSHHLGFPRTLSTSRPPHPHPMWSTRGPHLRCCSNKKVDLLLGGLRLVVKWRTKAYCTCWESLDLIFKKKYMQMIETQTIHKNVKCKRGKMRKYKLFFWSTLWMFFVGEVI